MKKALKEKICNYAKRIAVTTVGRSLPSTVHEPKVPKALAEKK